MRRIAIIGNGGGGKSTLARELGAVLDVPVHEVDPVQFRSDWSRVPVAEVERVLDGWLDGDAWIIDGFGPWPAIARRLDAADTIVLVDMPFRRHLWWTAKRQVTWRTTPDGRRRPPPARMLKTIVQSIAGTDRRSKRAWRRTRRRSCGSARRATCATSQLGCRARGSARRGRTRRARPRASRSRSPGRGSG